MLFDVALSGEFVETTRLSVTSAIGLGNFVRFLGVLICYCFITLSRGGSMPQGVPSNRTLFRSRHGDYGYIAQAWS